MNLNNEKEDFYKAVDQAILTKGEEWFNAWSESNPITNFPLRVSNDELSEIILDSSISNISVIPNRPS